MRTAEERAAHRRQLRDQWADIKRRTTTGELTEAEAIIKSHGMNVSPRGFLFVRLQMTAQGMDGLPYLDAKTFRGWQEAGFQVKKGEKSTLDGITWIEIGQAKEQTQDQQDGDGTERKDSFRLPRGYHLFHRSQVA